MEFYQRIRLRREELGLSQEELAIILGYKDRSTIAKIEKGINDLTQAKIVAFAEALKTTPQYLMGFPETSLEERADELSSARLFVDMDGTLAVFHPVDTLETLYEPGYFINLSPHENVLQAIRTIIQQHPEVEVNILSAVLTDSPFALKEKNEWLDRYLPELDAAHRFFPPCGADKKEFIPGGVRPTDYLLDDYTQNLTLWHPPGQGIKLLNGINHSRGTWEQDRIRYDKSPDALVKNILSVMNGEKVLDEKPQYTRDEVLNELRDQAWNNVLAYSGNYLMTEPKDGYEADWKAATTKAEIIDQMAQDFFKENKGDNIMETMKTTTEENTRFFILNDSIPKLTTYKMMPVYDAIPDFESYQSTLNVPVPGKDDFLIFDGNELSIASFAQDNFGEFTDFSGIQLEHNFRSDLDFLNAQMERGIIKEISQEEYKEQYRIATLPFFAKKECYDKQDLLIKTLLYTDRAHFRMDSSDLANTYSRINEQVISEEEYLALKKQQETSRTAEAAQEKSVVTPIEDNEHVKELLSIMTENNVPQQKELLIILDQVTMLERQLDAALKELATMREVISRTTQRNSEEKAAIQQPVKLMQNSIMGIKNMLEAVKLQIIEGCKNAVADFKQKGISALDNVVRLIKIQPALEAVNNKISQSIHFAEKAISNIEVASAEYHDAGRHIQNMARAVAGKEVVTESRSVGKLAKALEAPFKAEFSILSAMKKSAETALSQLTILGQAAGRDMVTETNQIQETSQSNVVPFFGKIDFTHVDGTVETIVYDDKSRYEAASSAQDEFGVHLTATEITETEYLNLKQEQTSVQENQPEMIIEESLEMGGE
jgi:transcriptional regulator with XRE-family HTH domain